MVFMAFSTRRVNMANMLPTKFPSLLRPYPSMRESWWSSCLWQHRVVICCHDSGDGQPWWPRIDIGRISCPQRGSPPVIQEQNVSDVFLPIHDIISPADLGAPQIRGHACCCDLSAIVFKGRLEISPILPHFAPMAKMRFVWRHRRHVRFGCSKMCIMDEHLQPTMKLYETLGGSRSHSVSIFSNGGF